MGSYYLSVNLDKPVTKLCANKALFSGKCVVIGCEKTDIEAHHVRALQRVKHWLLCKIYKIKK